MPSLYDSSLGRLECRVLFWYSQLLLVFDLICYTGLVSCLLFPVLKHVVPSFMKILNSPVVRTLHRLIFILYNLVFLAGLLVFVWNIGFELNSAFCWVSMVISVLVLANSLLTFFSVLAKFVLYLPTMVLPTACLTASLVAFILHEHAEQSHLVDFNAVWFLKYETLSFGPDWFLWFAVAFGCLVHLLLFEGA